MRKALVVAITVGLVLLAMMALGGEQAIVVIKWVCFVISIMVAVILPITVVFLLAIEAWPVSSSIPTVLLIVSIFSSMVITLKYWQPKLQSFAIWLGIAH